VHFLLENSNNFLYEGPLDPMHVSVNSHSDSITQCYLPSDTSEHTALTPVRQTGRYSIYLPQRDGRLGWPKWRTGLPVTQLQCHLPYAITQCYLSPDTSEHTSP